MAESPFLIIGLGNPGAEYQWTRHNIGFLALDVMHEQYSTAPYRQKFQGEYAEGKCAGTAIKLLKPLTYMNNSGRSARQVLDYYKIPVTSVIVLHDDLDLPFGHLRAKRGGGHGGHNGLRSLDQYIGKEYIRLRLGIGRPQEKNDVSDYVLSNFTKSERMVVEEICGQVSALLPFALSDQLPHLVAQYQERMRLNK